MMTITLVNKPGCGRCCNIKVNVVLCILAAVSAQIKKDSNVGSEFFISKGGK